MEKIEVKVEFDLTNMPKRIYSNIARVQRTPFEITILFGEAPAIYDIDNAKKNRYRLKAPGVAEIIIPFEVAKNLIVALQKQLSNESGDNDEKEKESSTD